MAGRADPAGAHVDLAGIGFAVSDKLRHGLRRKHRIHHHDQRRALDAGDGQNVFCEIEVEIGIERGVDGAGRTGKQQRVTVGRGVCHRRGADVGARPSPVLDDDLLAEPLRQRRRNQPGDDVERAGWRDRNDQMDRTRRPGIRACEARQHRIGSGGGGKNEQLSAVKFHAHAFRSRHFVVALANFTTLAHFSSS